MPKKERPIIFSGEMVRAILDGRKTQARRVIKPQPSRSDCKMLTLACTTGNKKNEGKHHWAVILGLDVIHDDNIFFSCPYGYIGDRLWVQVETADGRTIRIGITLEITDVRVERVQDIKPADCWSEGIGPVCHGEGLGNPCDEIRARQAFQSLWDSLNAKKGFGWNVNPWVWAIEFKAHSPR